MLKNVKYCKTKITKHVYKVCFISIQNTANEKFCNKTYLTSFFLNIIPIFTSAMLSSQLLPIGSKCSPHTKTSTLICRENQWNSFI